MLSRRLAPYLLLVPVVLLGSCTATPLEVAAADLDNGVEGRAYSQQLASSGDAPLHWSISDGELPPGLELNTDGEIVGTPDEAGDFAFTVRVRDSSLPVRTGEQSYSISVVPRLRLTLDLPAARVMEQYEATPTIVGGIGPYAFEAVGLPAGLGLNSATGTISGVPLFAYSLLRVDVRVTDSGTPQQTATDTDFLVVKAEAVRIVTTALATGQVGVPYSQTLSAEDGQTPYSWAVIDGQLPAGLHLNIVTGVISGSPTTAQASTFTIRVMDSDSPSSMDTATFTVEIVP